MELSWRNTGIVICLTFALAFALGFDITWKLAALIGGACFATETALQLQKRR